jgi:hypothetical protein
MNDKLRNGGWMDEWNKIKIQVYTKRIVCVPTRTEGAVPYINKTHLSV